jgi:hypothetical protein
MAALSQYVTFPPALAGGASPGGAQPASGAEAGTAPPAAVQSGAPVLANGLQKGMHQDQVRAILGNPTSAADTDHDGLQVHSETYAQGNTFVHAEFVNGVLVRYSVDVH